MEDRGKSREQLLGELAELRQQLQGQEFYEDIITTIREPLVVLSSELRVVAANRSFYETFQATAMETEGRLLYELGNHQWDIPRLRELLEEILPQQNQFQGFEVDHDFASIGRKTLVLNARQVYRRGGGRNLILLAIEDITERRRIVVEPFQASSHLPEDH